MTVPLDQPPKAGLVNGTSPVGVLCLNRPLWVSNPPVEAVVFAWGASEDHQLGLDTTDNVPAPKVVESLLGIRLRGREFARGPLIGGSRNTLAIDSEGQLWSWGWNDRATLGHGHRTVEHKPRRVAALKGIKIVQAAIGGWHCVALDENGQCYAWGGNEYLQCGVDGGEDAPRDVLLPEPCMPHLHVRQVACGGMNTLVLTTNGDMWTWGEPWGDFALDSSRAPRKVEGAGFVAAIACGAFHNMALTHSGEVYTWGTNDYGQLGNGTTNYSTTPQRVPDLDEVPVSDISAGGWHSLALTAHGQVYVWGRGEYGRLGVGDRTGSSKLRPHKVVGLEGHLVVQVAAGGTHTLVLTAEGRMFTWGRASYGRLGLSSERDHYAPVECVLPGGFDRWRVSAVTAGGRHSMCLAVPLRDAPLPTLEQQQQEEEDNRVASAAYESARQRARVTRDSSDGGAGICMDGEVTAAPTPRGEAPHRAPSPGPLTAPLLARQQAQQQQAVQQAVHQAAQQAAQQVAQQQAPAVQPRQVQQQAAQQQQQQAQALLVRLQSEATSNSGVSTAAVTSSGGYGPPALLPPLNTASASASRPGSSHGPPHLSQTGALPSALARSSSNASPRRIPVSGSLSHSPSRSGIAFVSDAVSGARSPHTGVSSPLLQGRGGAVLMSGSLPEWPSVNDAGLEEDEQDELRDTEQAQAASPLHAAARRLERETSELAKEDSGAVDGDSHAGSPSGSGGHGSPPGSTYDVSGGGGEAAGGAPGQHEPEQAASLRIAREMRFQALC